MTDVQAQLARYFAAVDEQQPPVELDRVRRSAPGRRRPSRVIALVAAATVAIAGVAGGVWLRAQRSSPIVAAHIWKVDGSVASARLDDIPEGVSVLHFGATPAFVARDGASVHVMLTNVQHLPREDTLWWCPHEQVFVAPAHGEAFSESGDVIGGPAERGLEQLTVGVHAGTVTARLDEIRLGARRSRNEPYNVPSGPWADQGGTFCTGALKNAPRPSSIISRGDAIERVGHLAAEIEPGAVFAAKLISGADNIQFRQRQGDVEPGGPGRDHSVWLVEVHGRQTPAFGPSRPRVYPWGYYSLIATTGEVTGTQLSPRRMADFATVRDLDG